MRIEAALAALCKEAVHDHAVPGTRRDVEAVLAERTPGSGAELVDSASQSRDALWATVRSGQSRVESDDPRSLRSDQRRECFAIGSEERAVEALDKVSQLLLVQQSSALCDEEGDRSTGHSRAGEAEDAAAQPPFL